MGSIERIDPKLPSKCRGMSPGRPLQLLTRNHFFQSERPEPPPPIRSIWDFSAPKIPKIESIFYILNFIGCNLKRPE